jgi:hypothetical protein
MLHKQLLSLFALVLLCYAFTAGPTHQVSAWSNGGYSGDPTNPAYGTHDWIAQHAMEWLPAPEKQFFIDNLASYLYGTELPDNSNTSDGVGDTAKHHVYFFANGSLQDDASAARAKTEYVNAQKALASGNFTLTAEDLGMVAHYVSDVAVFGHVMGAATAWSAETHHGDYEDYVLARTDSYSGDNFNIYLVFDGNLTVTEAYDAAVTIARDTTFDAAAGLNCIWMDQNYNWSNNQFKSRAGQSLNLAVNEVADVMHTFYVESLVPAPTSSVTPISPSLTPTSTVSIPEFPALSFAFATLFLVAVGLAIKSKKIVDVDVVHQLFEVPMVDG